MVLKRGYKMKKSISWFITAFFIYFMITYITQKNIFSAVLMLIAVILWLPLMDFMFEKILHKDRKRMMRIKIIISFVLLVGASIRIIF